MYTLAHPWVLLALPLPLLVRRLAPPYRAARNGLQVPFLDRLARLTGREPDTGAVVRQSSALHRALLIATWSCLLAALARPQFLEPPITRTVPVRDILLAVDLSGSMETKDFTGARGETVDRLSAVKDVLDDFLARRAGDRVGLIVFGSAPFVQAPFTEDLEVCRALLAEAQVRMAGPKTALGDALGLAITLFDRSNVRERVLIVLTDGNDTASQVPPARAAEIARDRGIVVHAVAVGDPRAAGEEALDEETLKTLSTTTGGLYSYAADLAQLSAIYARLDALQTRQASTVSHRPRRDVYAWPLGAALAMSILYHAACALASGRRPHGAVRVHHAGIRLPSGLPHVQPTGA
ncbi:MAG: VWA domain-containing protein [Lentisphaerae bacterium]|nr:VWA domain-containing protein [Lentisphaerota bacterium]